MKIFNSYLDKLVRPKVDMFHISWSAYQLCIYVGVLLGMLIALILALLANLPILVLIGAMVIAILASFGLAMGTKLLTGEERFTFYNYQIVVIAAAAAILWLIHQSLLPYLDLVIVALGTALACGRIGCLMVGCCHGRPHRWGVSYGREHAAVGFSRHLVGVRLFPIQAVESLWVICLVVTGSMLTLSGRAPGTGLSWNLIGYGAGRFCIEFWRGDPERPYLWGFSKAQWTSALLLCIVVCGEWIAILPFTLWHTGVAAFLLLTMMAVAGGRRLRSEVDYRLLLPGHVKELAEAVERGPGMVTRQPMLVNQKAVPTVPIVRTSLGIQLSTGKIEGSESSIFHYALSDCNKIMGVATAKTIARVISRLKHPSGAVELVEGSQGIFHLFIHSLLTNRSSHPEHEPPRVQSEPASTYPFNSSHGHLMGAEG